MAEKRGTEFMVWCEVCKKLEGSYTQDSLSTHCRVCHEEAAVAKIIFNGVEPSLPSEVWVLDCGHYMAYSWHEAGKGRASDISKLITEAAEGLARRRTR